MATISYCVSVSTEHEELDRLLNQLVTYLESEDELIVLVDESKVTQEVSQVITKYRSMFNRISVIGAPLNKNFATFKNKFLEAAQCEYIFQLDCDETLSISIFEGEEPYGDLKAILDINPNVDMFNIARENYVEDITENDIKIWGWGVDEKGRINYPDKQSRIFKNNKKISWLRPVHEILVGYTQHATLPLNYFIIHKKHINKQRLQNEFYNSI